MMLSRYIKKKKDLSHFILKNISEGFFIFMWRFAEDK